MRPNRSAPATASQDSLTGARHLSRRLRVLATAGAMLASTVVAFWIGEVATRYAFRHVRSTATRYGYFNRRAPAFRVNRRGYRDREFIVPKPPGVYRIAVVGDSLTYGQGLEEKDRFTALLDERLSAGGGEVLDLGLPGNDLPQHLETIRGDALALDPDFILLQLFVNDFDSPDAVRPLEPPPMFLELHAWLSWQSALYTVASIEWGTIKGELKLAEPYPDYLYRILSDDATPASAASRRALLAVIRACREAHRPLGIVFFPHVAFDLKQHYPFEYLNARVERICREEGVPYLDLRPVFAGARRDTLQVNRFDAHPSAKASRMAAAAILAAFGPLWHVSDH